MIVGTSDLSDECRTLLINSPTSTNTISSTFINQTTIDSSQNSATVSSSSLSSSSSSSSAAAADSFAQKSNISSLLTNINNNNMTRLIADETTETQDTDSGDYSEGASPREVGHNLYILAHKLAKFNKELSLMLKSKDCQEDEALAYYAVHTAQIEVYLL